MDETKPNKLHFADRFCGIWTFEAEACWAIRFVIKVETSRGILLPPSSWFLRSKKSGLHRSQFPDYLNLVISFA